MTGLAKPDKHATRVEGPQQNEALRQLASTAIYSGMGFYQGLRFPVQSLGLTGSSETVLDEKMHAMSTSEDLRCHSAIMVPLGDKFSNIFDVVKFFEKNTSMPKDISDREKKVWLVHNNLNETTQEFFLMFYGIEVSRQSPVVLYGLSTDSEFTQKIRELLKDCKGHGTRQVLADLLYALHPQISQILVGQILPGKGLPDINEVIELQTKQSLVSAIPTQPLLVDRHTRESILAPTVDDVHMYLDSSKGKLSDAVITQKGLRKQIIEVDIPLQVMSDGSIQAKAKEEHYKKLCTLASAFLLSGTKTYMNNLELKREYDDISYSVFQYNRKSEDSAGDTPFSTVGIHKKIYKQWPLLWEHVKTIVKEDVGLVVNLLNDFFDITMEEQQALLMGTLLSAIDSETLTNYVISFLAFEVAQYQQTARDQQAGENFPRSKRLISQFNLEDIVPVNEIDSEFNKIYNDELAIQTKEALDPETCGSDLELANLRVWEMGRRVEAARHKLSQIEK